ncbi:MAG: hypothetical protein JWN07_3263, partial [Hyphomicrobiales bacterium]|nr:hypothetical protein [Hyphomicrobiales bacterium]
MTLACLSRPLRAALAAAVISSTLVALAPAPALAGDRGGAVAAGILGGV